MMKAVELTLTKLRKAKNAGTTLNDFPAGFRLGARIKVLRDDGYNILTDKVPDYTAGTTGL